MSWVDEFHVQLIALQQEADRWRELCNKLADDLSRSTWCINGGSYRSLTEWKEMTGGESGASAA